MESKEGPGGVTMTVRVDPMELMAEHLSTLREYARRVLVRNTPLTMAEEKDRAVRMEEYRAVGASFDLTDAEMVEHLYRGLLRPQRGCDCPTCRSRSA